MASNPAQKSDSILDPIFHIPEGATGLVYDDKDRANTPSSEVDVDGSNDATGDSFIMDDGNDDTAGIPDVPEIIGVVEPQSIDRKPWGQQVIDVLIEVGDVAGDVKYEYRITKV